MQQGFIFLTLSFYFQISMKYILILLFLISGHFAMAQDSYTKKELKEIDRLILYNQYDSAQKKASDLYLKLQSEKNNNELLLETQFRQAVILDRQNDSSVEPLQKLIEIKDKAENEHLHSLTFRIYLMMALAYEKASHLVLTKKYLDKAYNVYKNQSLESLFSTYCIRMSSYCRFANLWDSSFYYAKQAKEYAEKYNNETDLQDSYTLLASFASTRKNYPESLKYKFLLLNYAKKINTNFIAISYNDISKTYLKMQDFKNALLYSDSAYAFYNAQTLLYKHHLPETRYKIYEALEKTESAYYYFKQYYNDFGALQKEEGKLKIKKLEEQYESDKKEVIIKNKNLQIILIASLLGIIIFGSVLLYRKSRKINKQNKTINRQLIDLSKTLEQKQVLLSELQHRVKNNLQHVISILEIQKESAGFNNIDELIRGNQNRIHSMALLHKKLNVSDNVNDVDLDRYIAELAELVKNSYDNHKKKIKLHTNCEIEKISIKDASPIGLIITELVSNSMKHAFKKQSTGMISIEITKDKISGQRKLHFTDNGEGFDFNKASKNGLGMEIIKGLIDQLNGWTVTKNDNGFELMIYF